MSMTPTAFRNEIRRAIADLGTSGAPEFDNPTIDGWRDLEVDLLYSKGFFARSSTRTLAGWDEPTVVSTIAGDGSEYVSRYTPMPTGFRRVYSIEFVDPNTGTFVGESTEFTDAEDPGFIRIDEMARYIDQNIRMHGEREFTGVDDTAIRAEVIDVALWGVVVRALMAEYQKRLKSARSSVATKNTDASPGAIAAGIEVARRLQRDAITSALDLQAVSALAR